MTLRLYQITAPHFVAGLEIREGVVIRAAPIVAYMRYRRWSEAQVLTYVESKGWSIALVSSK